MVLGLVYVRDGTSFDSTVFVAVRLMGRGNHASSRRGILIGRIKSVLRLFYYVRYSVCRRRTLC